MLRGWRRWSCACSRSAAALELCAVPETRKEVSRSSTPGCPRTRSTSSREAPAARRRRGAIVGGEGRARSRLDVIDSTRLVTVTANLGDVKTTIIHRRVPSGRAYRPRRAVAASRRTDPACASAWRGGQSQGRPGARDWRRNSRVKNARGEDLGDPPRASAAARTSRAGTLAALAVDPRAWRPGRWVWPWIMRVTPWQRIASAPRRRSRP